MFHIYGTAYRIIFDQKEKALSIFHGYRVRAIAITPFAFKSFNILLLLFFFGFISVLSSHPWVTKDLLVFLQGGFRNNEGVYMYLFLIIDL